MVLYLRKFVFFFLIKSKSVEVVSNQRECETLTCCLRFDLVPSKGRVCNFALQFAHMIQFIVHINLLAGDYFLLYKLQK